MLFRSVGANGRQWPALFSITVARGVRRRILVAALESAHLTIVSPQLFRAARPAQRVAGNHRDFFPERRRAFRARLHGHCESETRHPLRPVLLRATGFDRRRKNFGRSPLVNYRRENLDDCRADRHRAAVRGTGPASLRAELGRAG